MYTTLRGIVLRKVRYNDRDVLLTLLTEEQGKVTVKAKGLYQRKSSMAAVCELLAYGEYTVSEYCGRYTIKEASVIELFHSLRKSISVLTLATYFSEVAELLAQEDAPNPELLSLLLNSLYALSELGLPERQVKCVFELRAACIGGYMPDLYGCHVCGRQIPERMNISAGQLECAWCRDPDSRGVRMPINPDALRAMKYICYCHPKKIFAFHVNGMALTLLSELAEEYLVTQIERRFASLDYYKSLQNEGE